MTNFTVMTDAQLAAHDASTSKRYQAAAIEAQATIAKQEQTLESLGAALNELRAITKAGDCHMSFETLIRAGCATIAARDARIAALEAHIREAAEQEYKNFVARDTVPETIRALRWHKRHLAALNHTEQPLAMVTDFEKGGA